MADNAQKTWLPLSLARFGQKKALEAIDLLGKALPASIAAIPVAGVPIVEVKFEITSTPFTIPNTTVAMFGPEFIRYPIGIGTKGVVFPADFFLGGMTGLGTGTADLTVQANLSALMFFPAGNKNWDPSEAPQKILLYGPDGVILRDTAKTVTLTLTTSGVEVKGSGDALALVTNAMVALFNAHTHPSNGAPPTQQMGPDQLTTILKGQ